MLSVASECSNYTITTMNTALASIASFLVSALVLSPLAGVAGDWPQWHGPSRSGHASADAPAPTTLPKELKPAWKIPVGGGPKDVVKISMRHATMGEFQRVSHVTLDPYTGEVLRLEPLVDRAAGDRLIGNFSAVHFGVWGGQASRALWALLGLSLPLLFVTSLSMWWRRLRQRGLSGFQHWVSFQSRRPLVFGQSQ